MSALGWKADINQGEILKFERQLSARSRLSSLGRCASRSKEFVYLVDGYRDNKYNKDEHPLSAVC
jgi:hypothetical protein